MVALTTWALLGTRMPRSTLFFPLYLMSIGQGGYQPSLQAFGADQLSIGDDDDDDGDTEPGASSTPEEKAKVKSMFFRWWYFGMCSGSLLGNSTMSYVQDNLGWGLGFAIPCAVMALSVAAFFCCTPLYKRKVQVQQPKGAGIRPSPSSVFKSVLGASRKISLPPSRSSDDNGDAISELEYVVYLIRASCYPKSVVSCSTAQHRSEKKTLQVAREATEN